MSNDTSKQTLFRFVSLRNPQLTETKEKNLGFIFRPEGVEGHFDTAIETATESKKMVVLQKAADNFEVDARLQSEKKIEESDFADLLKIGRKISKKQTLSSEELDNLRNYYLGSSNFGKQDSADITGELEVLWNHLIYQTVTQKDFYVKEAVIQILKAIHIGYVQTVEQDDELLEINGEDFVKKALAAKVVLPSYLFVDGRNKEDDSQSTSVSKIFTVNESNISGAYISYDPFANKLSAAANRKLSNMARKTQEINIAKTAKAKLENLKTELEKVSEFYKKEYREAYKIAEQQNDLANKAALKNYKLQRLQVESNFDESMNEAARILAVENLASPELVELDFTFRDEVNVQDFQSKLSKEGLRTLVQLIGIGTGISTNKSSSSENMVTLDNGVTAILQLEDYPTYADIYQLIDTKISKYNELIIVNTSIPTENVVSLGGAVLSQKKTDSIAEGSYVLTPKLQNLDINVGSIYSFYQDPLYYYDFDLILDTSETIDSIEVSLKTNNGLEFSDYPADYYQSGNLTTISNIFYSRLDYTTFSTINQFSAIIYFKSGKTATIDLSQSFEAFKAYTGFLNFINEKSELMPCTYKACPSLVSGNRYNIELTLEMPNEELDVKSILYTHKDSSTSSNTNGYFVKTKNGSLIVLSELMGTSGSVMFDNSNDYLEVSIILNNDQKIDFTTPFLSPESCVSGSFNINGSSSGGNGTGGSSGTNTTTSDSFIPKGFGIKRLGIADYLKVEQSLHAYVPGEVSHIENIMAREYKEKSTRRLRRQENTNTTSTDTEREKLTDSTSASRFEMQSEISKMLQQSTDFGVNTNMNFGGKTLGSFAMSIGANFAHHQAKEESQRQAVTQSQDITTRALDRIVTKVHEERIEKIVEEFEENNKHGFDNTKGDKHVVGVYRWLDKRMKNQIYNYGKRMMFEFMIPEPAKLHTLAIDNLKKSNTKVIPIPVDPRTSVVNPMPDYTALADEITLNYWMSKYNVEAIEKLDKEIYVGKSFSNNSGAVGNDKEIAVASENIQIPSGYKTISAAANAKNSEDWYDPSNNIKEYPQILAGNTLLKDTYQNIDTFIGSIPVSYSQIGVIASNINISIKCTPTEEAEKAWQQKTFNAIIQAYEDALAEYNSQLESEDAKAKQISEENPNYYRQIEQEILKHNAIAFLTDDGDTKKLGQDLNLGATSMADYKVNRDNLDQYAALVKFMEQAFEWNIMSYNFYPYYWAGRKDWETMHLSDSVDPLFRSFLQSGMARVIVTVKPGFEDAVNFYFTTGKIWNGGEVPVIGDPMYLSIVDELRETPGKPEGNFWITQIPTSLNMLQEKSIGLVVDTALPLHEEDSSKCENPEMLVKKEDLDFLMNNDQIGQTSNKIIQFSWENMDKGFSSIGNLQFPRVYRCLNQEIVIDRDAVWHNTDSVTKTYQILADQLSLIDGVYAEVMEEKYQGITLKVDVTKIKSFELVKPGGSDSFDTLKFVTNAVDYITFPNQDVDYNIQRISDKNGVNLTGVEVGKKLNLDRFLV